MKISSATRFDDRTIDEHGSSSVGVEGLPHESNSNEYLSSASEASEDRHVGHAPDALRGMTGSGDDSEGGDNACVVGCNSNNGNAGRTANCNNAVSNGNDNYAGAFALRNGNDFGKTSTSQPSRLKNNDGHTANGGYGQCDYSSLPFMENGGENTESNANCPIADEEVSIWEELRRANEKRNLKCLFKFYASVEIAEEAVRRCCSEKQDNFWRQAYMRHSHLIAKIMVKEVTEGTYHVRGYRKVKLPRNHKTDKEREAKIYTLYDRCIQMFILVIIEQKCRRKVLRNNYSNIEGRGIFCNDKRFCMLNKIRFATKQYNGLYAYLTDIRHFYQSVYWKVLLGVVFEFIKDDTTRWLLVQIYQASQDMPIGSSLSPLFSDILMNEFDMEILRKYKPRAFFAFGDNRMFIADLPTIYRIKEFQQSFYAGRYNLTVKKDYQICKVEDGFRFCKTWYKNGFVKMRGEMRRRAIRCAERPQSFAGYRGMMMKTDSAHLLHMIDTDIHKLRVNRYRMLTNEDGLGLRDFEGISKKIDDWVGHTICVTNYAKCDNGKASEFYILIQYQAKGKDGDVKTYKTKCGHFEIKQAALKWQRDNDHEAKYVTVEQDGKNIYFKEYHVTNKEATDIIAKEKNVDFSKLN